MMGSAPPEIFTSGVAAAAISFQARVRFIRGVVVPIHFGICNNRTIEITIAQSLISYI